jgi:hypothetical protein
VDGCYTRGDTLPETLRMAQDATALHLYAMGQDGEAIPFVDLESIETAENERGVSITVRTTPFRNEMESRRSRKHGPFLRGQAVRLRNARSTTRRFCKAR